jgi:hypothetical protein
MDVARIHRMTEPLEPTRRPSNRRLPPLARTVLAAILAFLIGFGWQYVTAHQLRHQLDQVTRERDLAQLEAMLANTAIDVQRGGYELGRREASEFYTGAQRLVSAAPTSQDNAAPERALRRVLLSRDATISLLSRGDPQAADVLTRSLVEYRAALRSERGLPATPAASTTPTTPIRPDTPADSTRTP